MLSSMPRALEAYAASMQLNEDPSTKGLFASGYLK